jgi:hypothetical protein
LEDFNGRFFVGCNEAREFIRAAPRSETKLTSFEGTLIAA